MSVRVPGPHEVREHHESWHQRMAEDILTRVSDHLLVTGEQEEHRIPLRGEPERAVEIASDNLRALGWFVEREAVNRTKGPYFEFGCLLVRATVP
jgi:hypothetical protein